MNIIKTISLSLFGLILTTSISAQTLKEPVNFKLKNGMNIIVSESERSNNAYASFTLNNQDFADRKDGVLELLNMVLNENSKQNKHVSFKDNSGKLATSEENFDQELSQMASVIQHANIEQTTFNIAKAKLLTSLKNQDYDYDQTVNETSIGALNLEDVSSFYHQITPENCYLTIAGNIKLDKAKDAAKKAFANWSQTKNTSTLTAK